VHALDADNKVARDRANTQPMPAMMNGVQANAAGDLLPSRSHAGSWNNGPGERAHAGPLLFAIPTTGQVTRIKI